MEMCQCGSVLFDGCVVYDGNVVFDGSVVVYDGCEVGWWCGSLPLMFCIGMVAII